MYTYCCNLQRTYLSSSEEKPNMVMFYHQKGCVNSFQCLQDILYTAFGLCHASPGLHTPGPLKKDIPI